MQRDKTTHLNLMLKMLPAQCLMIRQEDVILDHMESRLPGKNNLIRPFCLFRTKIK
jgi:hypothetical protein